MPVQISRTGSFDCTFACEDNSYHHFNITSTFQLSARSTTEQGNNCRYMPCALQRRMRHCMQTYTNESAKQEPSSIPATLQIVVAQTTLRSTICSGSKTNMHDTSKSKQADAKRQSYTPRPPPAAHPQRPRVRPPSSTHHRRRMSQHETATHSCGSGVTMPGCQYTAPTFAHAPSQLCRIEVSVRRRFYFVAAHMTLAVPPPLMALVVRR